MDKSMNLQDAVKALQSGDYEALLSDDVNMLLKEVMNRGMVGFADRYAKLAALTVVQSQAVKALREQVSRDGSRVGLLADQNDKMAGREYFIMKIRVDQQWQDEVQSILAATEGLV